VLGATAPGTQASMTRLFLVPVFLVLTMASALAQAPVLYTLSFPAPEHHYAEIEVAFADLPPAALEVRMSRSSPGRYAIHEYAKNVFDVRAFDGRGRALAIERPNPYQWNVAGHDGAVRIVYKVFGNRVDGTYLGIDASHAHLNMPATLMWARGLDDRAARVRFVPPAGLAWKVATQLFPTSDGWTFTAPNLQYLMDSPAELSAHSVRSFKVRNPDGREQTIITAVHHDATEADVDAYAAGTERIVLEQGAIFGEFPEFDGGTYTFLGDYLPWGGGDGMEHRNSTVVADGASIRGNVDSVLDTVSHEFFHAWNVERIRPRSLEPFDFEGANMSGELWLAEGFTQYYGLLVMARAGLTPPVRIMESLVSSALGVATHPGHRLRSAVEMSQLAAFTDSARSIDPTNFSYAFINYYGFGSALALALDLDLRQRSDGKVSLDDYMRAMWRVHGKPAASAPGLVARPYTLADARDRLADVSNREFADEFFARFVEGREVPDYAALLAPAGIRVRKRHPGRPWTGATIDSTGRVTAQQGLVPWGSPAFEAGLEHGDTIAAVGGKPFSPQALQNRKPGERIDLEVKRIDGRAVRLALTLGEDPALEAVPVESTGGTLTPSQRAFRDAWLGSKRK
jgi:predicted metalloprotease with PDZ domain